MAYQSLSNDRGPAPKWLRRPRYLPLKVGAADPQQLIPINPSVCTSRVGDVEEGNRGLGATPRGGRSTEHYREIAQTLLAAESADVTVGVPWLAPTAKVRARRASVSDSLLRFIRLSLSTVSTESLESYCEDLESLPFEAKSSEILGIRELSFIERYLWAILGSLTLASVSWRIFESITGALRGSITAGIGVGIIAFLLFAEFSSEPYRRMSFASLLLKEIRRRRGIFPDQNNAITVGPLGGPKPLSE